MDGKLRSDDTVSMDEWNDFVRGRRLLEPTRDDRLRNECSAPTIDGTITADMSTTDMRQELFQSGTGMLTGADSSGPISPESMSNQLNRCTMCNQETYYRLLRCDCGISTCQKCWNDELEQCYHCTWTAGWNRSSSMAYMGVSDDSSSLTVSLERPSPDRQAGAGDLQPLVLSPEGHPLDRMADGVVSSDPSLERQRRLLKKIWKRQRHEKRRRLEAEEEKNKATAMTVNSQQPLTTASGPPTEFAPPGYEA